jgi:hypothetical protein
MVRQDRWVSTLAWLVTATLWAGSCGCMSFLHPVQSDTQDMVEYCKELPDYSRDHVYVFLVHGMDPLDYANLRGMRDYLHQLGFNKVYYGQLYHTPYFKKELVRIHEEEPEAHFVLIGFSFGANMVRNMAVEARDHGIPIDLLMYMGGNTLENVPDDRPENALRIVNILACGCIWNGATLDGAENINLDDVWHFGSPSHARTIETLTRQMAAVAGDVPVPQPEETAVVPGFSDEPTPRPALSRGASKRDDWDFLKPVSRLKPPREESPTDDKPAGKAGKEGSTLSHGVNLIGSLW